MIILNKGIILKTEDNKSKKPNFIMKTIKKLSKFCCDILFPEDIKCIFCGNDIPNFDEKPYCEICEKEIVFNDKNKCLICAEPIENEAVVCDSCQKNKRFFKKAVCPLIYNGKVRSAILSYKDSNQRYKAKVFANLIAKEIQKEKLNIDVITYVPLTEKKKKKRTFDQSELLAFEIGKILNLPVLCLFKKERDSKAQKKSSFKERQENMKGMYSLLPTKLKKAYSVLIVDDIITTCATINYCSGLLEKKVKNVYVCAIARNKLKQK